MLVLRYVGGRNSKAWKKYLKTRPYFTPRHYFFFSRIKRTFLYNSDCGQINLRVNHMPDFITIQSFYTKLLRINYHPPLLPRTWILIIYRNINKHERNGGWEREMVDLIKIIINLGQSEDKFIWVGAWLKVNNIFFSFKLPLLLKAQIKVSRIFS